jgi:dihydrolipoyl dehydrogenase
MKMKMLIIGGGPAGRTAAMEAAQLGEEVVLIERKQVGGTCLHEGCMVVSGLNDVARFYLDSQKYTEMGIISEECTVNFKKVAQGVKRITDKIGKILEIETRETGAEIISGEAKLMDSMVEVKGEKHDYDKLLIATGARPFLPQISGVEHAINYQDVLDLKKIPGKVLIVGGGAIAAEFANIFFSFGSEVKIISRNKFLGNLDPDIKSYVMGNLLKDVEIMENTKLGEINRRGAITSQGEVEGKVFLATGMTPNSEIAKGIVEVGLKNEIIVDKEMKTSHPNIYAAGDVVGTIGTTPIARREGIVAARNACGVPSVMDYDLIPRSLTLYYQISTLISDKSSKGVEATIPGSAGPGSFWRVLDGDTGLTKMSVDLTSGNIEKVSSISPSSRTTIPYLAKMIRDGYKAGDFDDFLETHPSTDAIYKLLHFFAKHI